MASLKAQPGRRRCLPGLIVRKRWANIARDFPARWSEKLLKRIIFLSAALAASISALGEVFEVKPETRYMLTYDWSVDGQCRDFADDPEGRSKIYGYRGDEYACEVLYFGSGRSEKCVCRMALAPGNSGRMNHEFYTDSSTVKVRAEVGTAYPLG